MSHLYKYGEGAQRLGLRAGEPEKTRSRSAAKTSILLYKNVYFVAATADSRIMLSALLSLLVSKLTFRNFIVCSFCISFVRLLIN
jgi:hypothetical protein